MLLAAHRRAGMKDATRATWAARVEEWRRSGKTAEEFAADQPFSGGTLAWRASQLKRETVTHRKPSATPKRQSKISSKLVFAEVVRRTRAAPRAAAMTLEIGGARISVSAGFDATLLRDVVRALGEEQS